MKSINMSTFSGSDNDQYTESELQKAFPADKYRIISDEGMAAFHQDLDKLIKKGESSVLLQEEVDAIEKGKRDAANGWQKITVTRSDGVRTGKWVKIKEAEPGKSNAGEKAPAKALVEHSYEELERLKAQGHIDFAHKRINEVQFDALLTKIANATKAKKDAEKETGIVNEVDQPHKTAMNNLHKKVTGEDTKATSKNKIKVPEDKYVPKVGNIGRTGSGKTVNADPDHESNKTLTLTEHREAAGMHKKQAQNYSIQNKKGNKDHIDHHNAMAARHMELYKERLDRGSVKKITVDSPLLMSHADLHGKKFDVVSERKVNMATGAKKFYTIKDSDGDEYELSEDYVKEAAEDTKKDEKPEKKAPAKMYKELQYFKDAAQLFRSAAKQTQNDKDNAAQYDQYAKDAQAKIDAYEKKDSSNGKTKAEKGYSPDLQKAFSVLNITK